jgi:gliding motility-associated-like protein
VTSFNLKINPTPIANNIGPVELCDDDYDLLLTIDLTDFNQAILGNQNSAEFAVSYYSAEDDALQLTNAIDTTQEYIASSETLFVRVENMETACFNITNLELDILRKPFIEIPDQVLCLDDLPLTVSASTGVASDSYLWSNNTIASTINITEIGIYSVTITTNKGCTVFAEFNVIQSAPAIIEFTETIDFSDPNNITVTVSGIGDYFYQLDDGVPQVSNIFTNVPLGPHTITVIDLNGCSSVTKDVVIVDTPKFVTPNSDGYFDTWHITGVEQLVGTTIYIFDRYGKQMAYLTHDSFGWDGTYNGNNMPASDYWFTADVVSGTKRFQIKGHFALRR